jgi:uncharacterized membrane protein
MKGRVLWLLMRLARRLWVRVGLFALLGVLSALLSIWAAPLLPEDISARVGAEAVDKVLGVIASSMLTVAIFSLSTLVSAYATAASGATPRATQLLQEDSGALNALATFIGAFLFSLVGIIALSTGAYGASGRVVMFAVTLLMVALVVTTFIGWIDRLSRLGRIGETIDRVAEAAAAAMRQRCRHPHLGGAPPRPVPAAARAVAAEGFGYVQHIDVKALSGLTKAGEVDVAVLPGAYVARGEVLAHLPAGADDEACAAARAAFILGERRSFEQDPRFGVIVLSEIASRALSPAVNDPGTAIDVLAALVRVLAVEAEAQESEGDCLKVHVPPLDRAALLEDCIVPIARDGAGLIEVQLRLQRMLAAIAKLPGYDEAARRLAGSAKARGLAALSAAEDRARLAEAGAWAGER